MDTIDKQVFLCHASEDKDKVLDFCNILIKRGYKPWVDKKDLLPGQYWDVEIQKAIKRSNFMIIFLSKYSVSKRGYVQKEFKMGLETLKEVPSGQIFIIPVRLDNCEIPYEFKSLHCVDLFRKDGVEAVIKSLNAGLAQFELKEKNAPVTKSTSSSKSTRKRTTQIQKVLWRCEKKSDGKTVYYIYFDGVSRGGTRFMWSGTEDALIFDPQSRNYYELKGYKKYTDGKLRPAILTTVPSQVLWRREETSGNRVSYYLYVNGELLSRTRFMWQGKNEIVYHPRSRKYYELIGFKNYLDGKLRSATLVEVPGKVLWRSEGKTYYIYV